MALSTKTIKTRISSVKNTKKITKAMEMVAAAKMRKAVEAALSTRMYAELSLELLKTLSQTQEVESKLLASRPVRRVLLVLITSNRGLCGSFNANIFKYSKNLLQKTKVLGTSKDTETGKEILSEDFAVDVYGIGKRSALFAKRNNVQLVAVDEALGDKPPIEAVTALTNELIQLYTSKKYDKVILAFTHYKSSLLQVVKTRQLLPVSRIDIEKMLSELPDQETDAVAPLPLDTYILEPDEPTIIETILPRLLDTSLYEALLESAASEHSARMVAMKNATEAAGDMINALTLEYNKARQAGITKEIAEISGGAAALE
ncbi:MAG: ATP synthase F1 subunit gamma [Candidatus Magasanikbacteria bacterium RIFCSPHIGHO2_02_FULL_47_14]|uniref:ATP synthase gamma chain n=1 Tax=Candidatus Magasanikbacteria bacterium RIFCSPHIGHO2_02_FULL_47_14 TaxID=1798680 RepID=A0A1F6LYY7_9BACT|nr:MAG: ATP synthase F1 subunit gamma [Candidatus Magasanikbacteria bacterium RIFCSPHIGHO2_02_FULL_47_14]